MSLHREIRGWEETSYGKHATNFHTHVLGVIDPCEYDFCFVFACRLSAP